MAKIMSVEKGLKSEMIIKCYDKFKLLQVHSTTMIILLN